MKISLISSSFVLLLSTGCGGNDLPLVGIPGDPQDVSPGSCLSLSGSSGAGLFEFDPQTIGTTHQRAFTLFVPEDKPCNFPDSGEELLLEFDNPDGAFSLDSNPPGITFQHIQEEDFDIKITFAPSVEGSFEAQLRIGFPSSFEDEFRGDLLLQLFGEGLESDES